jgi:hypothetical protein
MGREWLALVTNGSALRAVSPSAAALRERAWAALYFASRAPRRSLAFALIEVWIGSSSRN